MNYCKKCLRVLNEGEKFCPACGEAVTITIENPADKHTEPGTASQLDELNSIIEENKAKKETAEAAAPYAQPVSPGPYSKPIDLSTSTTHQSPGAYTPSQTYSTASIPADAEVPMSTKVILTILSVLIAPAGIIVGIINMNNKSKAYRSFGQVMLIVGITQMAVVLLCCCAGSIFSSSVSGIFNELRYYY